MAIQDLERLRATGANYLALVWSSFWWLDHYQEFHRYLGEKFRCMLSTENVMVFDLQP